MTKGMRFRSSFRTRLFSVAAVAAAAATVVSRSVSLELAIPAEDDGDGDGDGVRLVPRRFSVSRSSPAVRTGRLATLA